MKPFFTNFRDGLTVSVLVVEEDDVFEVGPRLLCDGFQMALLVGLIDLGDVGIEDILMFELSRFRKKRRKSNDIMSCSLNFIRSPPETLKIMIFVANFYVNNYSYHL